MAKYLDANGVKRLVSQLWARMKTLTAGKEDVRLTKYVTITANNSTTTLNFGSDYYVIANSTAVTATTLSLKLPSGWQSLAGTLHMDIMLRSDSGARINVVNADGFGIYKTMNFSDMYTKGGCHLHLTWFHTRGNTWGTMVCEVNQMR